MSKHKRARSLSSSLRNRLRECKSDNSSSTDTPESTPKPRKRKLIPKPTSDGKFHESSIVEDVTMGTKNIESSLNLVIPVISIEGPSEERDTNLEESNTSEDVAKAKIEQTPEIVPGTSGVSGKKSELKNSDTDSSGYQDSLELMSFYSQDDVSEIESDEEFTEWESKPGRIRELQAEAAREPYLSSSEESITKGLTKKLHAMKLKSSSGSGSSQDSVNLANYCLPASTEQRTQSLPRPVSRKARRKNTDAVMKSMKLENSGKNSDDARKLRDE